MYGDNEDKQRGIVREPIVAKRILEYFKSKNGSVKMEQASLLEDMRKKYDYKYTCDVGQSFSKNTKITEIKVDVKCGKTFTLIDSKGNNTLEKSESTYVVFELYEDAEELLWVSTGKLKECIAKKYPELRLSKQEGNMSRYFFIEEYIKKNQKFLGNFVKYIK